MFLFFMSNKILKIVSLFLFTIIFSSCTLSIEKLVSSFDRFHKDIVITISGVLKKKILYLIHTFLFQIIIVLMFLV